jgi:hypothetical protein
MRLAQKLFRLSRLCAAKLSEMSAQHRALFEILQHLRSRVCELESLHCVVDRGRRVDGLGVQVEILNNGGSVISEGEYEKHRSSAVAKPIKGKPYKISKKTLDTIVANLNEYWDLLLGVPVNFKMTEVDVAYVTASDTALFRNTFLSGFFVEPPVVVDAYAGIGMDTVSFLYNLYCRPEIGVKFVYAVENSDDYSRTSRLQHNLHEYIRAKEGIPENAMIPMTSDSLGGRVEIYPNGTEAFFQNCKNFKTNPVNSIDLLYIDPPWTLEGRPNSGANGEATPMELLEFLYDTIFKHLIRNDVHVKMVCIKTRFTWEQCKPFLDILRSHMKYKTDEFTHTATVENRPFKNVYYFHVIKTNEAANGKWQPSEYFQKAYKTTPQRGVEGGKDASHKIVHHSEEGEKEVVKYERPTPDDMPQEPFKLRR